MFRSMNRGIVLALLPVCSAFVLVVSPIVAEESTKPAAKGSQAAENLPARQAALEAALSKSLSGATLEGSFTRTSGGDDPTKLAREKYTLGEVKKVGGEMWQIPARIQYGEKDVTIPITLPIRWAGDTPVVVVDNLAMPGFGAVSARVMFFDGHYAGYWKHGAHGGSLFGVIHPAAEAASPAKVRDDAAPGVKR